MKSDEDRWECAAALKEVQICFSDYFLDLFYLPFYKQFIDSEIGLDTDDLNCKVKLAEDMPELIFIT